MICEECRDSAFPGFVLLTIGGERTENGHIHITKVWAPCRACGGGKISSCCDTAGAGISEGGGRPEETNEGR
jgi:hypothetical protein